MKIITQISLFDDTQNENLGDLERFLICKTNFHPYMTCRGSYYFRISGVEITYS